MKRPIRTDPRDGLSHALRIPQIHQVDTNIRGNLFDSPGLMRRAEKQVRFVPVLKEPARQVGAHNPLAPVTIARFTREALR